MGPHTIDRFANSVNAQVHRLILGSDSRLGGCGRLTCAGEDLVVVPPVYLITRVIRHAQAPGKRHTSGPPVVVVPFGLCYSLMVPPQQYSLKSG